MKLSEVGKTYVLRMSEIYKTYTDYYRYYKLNSMYKPTPPSTKRKNSTKLIDCQIFNVVLGYSNIGVI